MRYRWMRYFFTEDVLSDKSLVVELQRRAMWIGLALILQSLNELDHDWYIPYLKPFGSLIPFTLILGSFFAIWMAFRPTSLRQQAAHYKQKYPVSPTRWQRIWLILIVVLAIIGSTQLVRGVVMSFLPPQFSNDGTSLDTNAAILLLHGRNPYTDSNILDIVRRFPIQPSWTTPLQRGQFANHPEYPTIDELRSVLDSDLKANAAPEFESKVSYPVLSFLTLVPFVLLKNYNVLPFYLLSYLLLIAVAWRFTRPELRPWVLLLSLANIPMWGSTIGGNLDIFCMLLVVLAWLLRNQRWSSAVFFGLAVATKQIAWFFIPFYIIMVWRHYGMKEMFYRLSLAGSIGLAFNLPFILWNPQAWIAGILTPMVDPMFPMGVGIINLSVTHLLPFFPNWTYALLEGSALLLVVVWYWHLCRKYPESAMLLAVLPLFLAWRSLPSYFYCAAYPLFVLVAARMVPASPHTARDANTCRERQGFPIVVSA